MTEPKTIPVSYDIAADPDADQFDPIAWYLGTGEDLGLPEGWLEEYQANLAKAEAYFAKHPPPG